MIPLAITALLAWPRQVGWTDSARTYEWTDNARLASSYRLRWSVDGRTWCANDKVEVPLTQCPYWHPENAPGGAAGADGIPNRCTFVYFGSAPFVVVTEIIGGVEQPTGHGAIVGCP